MASLAASLLDLREMDRLALKKTPLHRLDPKAKVLATACFLAVLGSFPRLEVSSLLPLAVFPVALAVFGEVPFGALLRKVMLGLPFMFVLGVFLPVLDSTPVLRLGAVEVSAGWLAFGSLMARGTLAVAAATALVAVTGFGDVCAGLDRLAAPRVFVQQLLFLYRYLSVAGEETQRGLLARDLRAHGRPMAWGEYPSFIGNLLLRSWERAERVHGALLARGFRGILPARTQAASGLASWAFVLGWSCFFLACRLFPFPRLLGALVAGGAS
ncbi:MAG: cobalt ECF transporter T component CbiQ [Acidobacteriota bacterium]|nr:cobalt ECF transporter T component CbiQ [Acidobacteriota bacterium]